MQDPHKWCYKRDMPVTVGLPKALIHLSLSDAMKCLVMPDVYLPDGCVNGDVTYKALAEHIKSLVISGVLLPGTKLPPIRELARRLQISGLTVQRAYGDLAKTGFTEAATHRGTWVASELPAHLSRAMVGLGRVVPGHVTEQSGVRTLTHSGPDPTLFDAREFCSELSGLRGRSKWTWNAAPTYGAPELLTEISKLLRSTGLPSSGDQLLVTLGQRHSLSTIGSLLAGSSVLLEDPRAEGTRSALEQAGVTCISYSRTHSRLNISELVRLCEIHSPSAIIVSTGIHNPTGGVLDHPVHTELLRLARSRGILVIELDPLREISFDQNLPIPLAAQDEGRVLYVGSFESSITPAVSLGFIRCSSRMRKDLGEVMANNGLLAPLPLQLATASYISNGGYRRHLNRVVPRYRARRDTLHQALSMYMPQCEAPRPRGGFTTWAFLPPAYASMWTTALRKGVAIGRGGSYSDKADADLHACLSFASLGPDSIREAVRLLAAPFEPEEYSA